MELKSAEDKDIYDRYKNNHDGTMAEFVKWYERGKEPKRYNSPAHKKARQVVIRLKKGYTLKEITQRFDTYTPLLQRLINKDFRRVPMEKAKEIARAKNKIDRGKIEIPEKDTGPTKEQRKEAIRLLKKHGAEKNVRGFCRKHDLPYRQTYGVLKENYKYVHPVVEEIIRKLK